MSGGNIIVRTIMRLIARCGIFSVVGNMARLVSRVLFFMGIRPWISLIHSAAVERTGAGQGFGSRGPRDRIANKWRNDWGMECKARAL